MLFVYDDFMPFIQICSTLIYRVDSSIHNVMQIVWKGKGLNEIGYNVSNKKKIIAVDKNYIRPLDVNTLLGNAAKARRELKWKP